MQSSEGLVKVTSNTKLPAHLQYGRKVKRARTLVVWSTHVDWDRIITDAVPGDDPELCASAELLLRDAASAKYAHIRKSVGR